MQHRGYYIVLEGGEGCGKSTHAKSLAEFMNQKGIPAFYMREPGSTDVADKIRELLLDKKSNIHPLSELFLFEAARTEFFSKQLIRELENGVSIVSDRSFYSSEAYQGYAGGVDLDFIRQVNTQATFGVNPDLAIFIHVSAEKGLSKETQADRFAAKGLEYHKRVNAGFLTIARSLGDRAHIIPYREGDEEGMQDEIRRVTKEKLRLSF